MAEGSGGRPQGRPLRYVPMGTPPAPGTPPDPAPSPPGTSPDPAEEETIPLARPSLGAAEERAVLEVLRSGQLSLGPRVGEFERAFAERVGAAAACAVSSGTAGLHLALRAAGVGPGDEVVTSPFSFVASANAVVYEGARPVFADIDPMTLNLDPDAVRAAVSERTRAILPVHIFGYPAEMDAFEAIARQYGLAIVEDACEALGARHPDGRPVGGRGNPAVFGFYANKQITTGEGGMITLGDPALKERIDSERNQGRSPQRGWLDHDGHRVRPRSGAAGAPGRVPGGASADRRPLPGGAAEHQGSRAAVSGYGRE